MKKSRIFKNIAGLQYQTFTLYFVMNYLDQNNKYKKLEEKYMQGYRVSYLLE